MTGVIISVSTPDKKGRITILLEIGNSYYTKLISMMESSRYTVGKEITIDGSWKKSL